MDSSAPPCNGLLPVPRLEDLVERDKNHDCSGFGPAHICVRVDSVAESFAGRVEHISPTTEFSPRYIFSERERPSLVVRVRVRIDDPKHQLHRGVPAFVKVQGMQARQ